MKKVLLTLGTIGCLATMVLAGPGWSRVNYTRSTIFTGVVTFDGQPAAEGDMIGIFVGNECRMSSAVFSRDGVSYVSAVLHGESVENVSVKFWRSETGKTYNLDTAFATIPDGEILSTPLRVKSGEATTIIQNPDEKKFDVLNNGSKVTVTSDKIVKSIAVIDNIGKRVSIERGGIGTFAVSTDELPDGMYFLTFTFDDNTVITKKVIVRN